VVMEDRVGTTLGCVRTPRLDRSVCFGGHVCTVVFLLVRCVVSRRCCHQDLRSCCAECTDSSTFSARRPTEARLAWPRLNIAAAWAVAAKSLAARERKDRKSVV